MERRDLLGALVPLTVAGCLRLDEEGEDAQQAADGTAEDRDVTGGDDTDAEETDSDESSEDTNEKGTESNGSQNEETESDQGNGDEAGIPYPTGLSEDDVSAVLSGAHRNALGRTTAALEWSITGGVENHNDETVRMRLGDGQALGEIGFGDQAPVTLHSASDSGYWRAEFGGDYVYGRDRPSRWYDIGWLTRSDRLGHLVRTGDWNPPEYDEESGLFTIVAEGIADGGAMLEEIGADSLESFSATGVVDEDGIVREFDAKYEYRVEDRLLPESVRLRVDEIGAVTVNQPDWLVTAREEAPEVSIEIVEGGEFVELTMESGNALPDRVDGLTLHSEAEGGWRCGLSEPLSAGDTLYLYVEDDTGRIARDGIPANADPRPFESGVAVWASWNLNFFFETAW